MNFENLLFKIKIAAHRIRILRLCVLSVYTKIIVANTDLGRKLSWMTRACKPLVLNR